ncbi:hypothetical protein ABEB36_013308 [Hypothenemus hampei]|uniref:Uncharacterized protein n=1 Tax=Hypothenemus hampei TaxID=57062 RepID=A0ABD1E7U2_HYPHA
MSSKKSDNKRSIRNATNSQALSTDPSEAFTDIVLDPEKDLRTVVITVVSFKNILPLYPTSDVKVSLKYLGKELGETQPVVVTDDENLQVNQQFEIVLDVNSTKELDLLCSNPVYITALQTSGSLDFGLYERLQETQPTVVQEVESLYSMYEAFTGEQVSVRPLHRKKKDKKKSKKGSRDKSKPSHSKSSNSSVKSKKSKKSKSLMGSSRNSQSKSDTKIQIKSEIYGICVLDLIGLFYGETTILESLLLKPVKRSCHILSTFKNFPQVSLKVSIKEGHQLLENINNILNFTVESICNAPSLLYSDLECTVCSILPLQNSGSAPIVFHNPKITCKSPKHPVPKRWPSVLDIGYNTNTTKYLISNDYEDIINKNNFNIAEAYQENVVRIEYNYLKRNVLFKNGNNNFVDRINTFRKLVLEIYATPKSKKYKSVDPFDEEIHLKYKQPGKLPPYLHLIAVFDMISLLYPGVTKLRIAAPVKTFTYAEAAKYGLEDSYFIPKLKTSEGRSSKQEAAKKKKSEKRGNKSPKRDKTSIKEDKNLANHLPPKPEESPPPEPSEPVFNEEGKPCFVIVEIELLKPITPKRELEELQLELNHLQLEALQTSKIILNKTVAEDIYIETIKEIVKDLNKKWLEFNETMNMIPQPSYDNFVDFLKRKGAYQTYTNSIMNSSTILITNKYKCEQSDFKHNKNYQNLISEIFTELISQMHSVLNTLVCTGTKPLKEHCLTTPEEYFFNAKEAAELQLYEVSERYFLERICLENKPEAWVDYAIYNLEIQREDKAFECVREAMARNPHQKYALLLYGALLTEKYKIQEAETCFLNLMVQHSTWVDGWCVLYLFYQKISRDDGIDMALEMAKKNYCKNIECTDDLTVFQDLAWSSSNLPRTMFFQVATLLLKLRLFSWVERALTEEVLIPKHYGHVNYILATISYYKKNLNHALEHAEEAKEHLGADFALHSLFGHILFRKNLKDKAIEQYFRVIESYNRPDDIHLVNVNCAAALEDTQLARKLLLNACKYHQTPQVWLRLGKLYFEQNDLLSAEECFHEANVMDNKLAEAWGYLTLVNLKLNRLHEAEQCYQQTMKSGLDDKGLNDKIIDGFNNA